MLCYADASVSVSLLLTLSESYCLMDLVMADRALPIFRGCGIQNMSRRLLLVCSDLALSSSKTLVLLMFCFGYGGFDRRPRMCGVFAFLLSISYSFVT